MKFFLLSVLVLSLPLSSQVRASEKKITDVSSRRTISADDKAAMISVLTKNDSLFNSFLKRDKAQIEKNASELLTFVKNSQSPLLVGVKKDLDPLSSIKSSKTMEENVSAYGKFLVPLITVVQSYDVGGKFNVFTCPMVKKSWIQNIEVNKEVKNVYAMDMLECGSQDTHY